jgi:hypothetical protein
MACGLRLPMLGGFSLLASKRLQIHTNLQWNLLAMPVCIGWCSLLGFVMLACICALEQPRIVLGLT